MSGRKKKGGRRFRFIRWLLRFRRVRLALILLLLLLLLGLLVDLLDRRVLGARSTLALPFFIGMYALAVGAGAEVARRYRGRRRFRTSAFNELLAFTPAQFETAVAAMLHDLGYHDIRQVGGSGDLGADITCRDTRGRSVVVQCKRYAPGARVGSRDLQAFIGMLAVHHHADRGIFVTTSEFTEPAWDLARRHDIELFDGSRIRGLVNRIALPYPETPQGDSL